ncbi:microtubule associated protein [Ophiocordyceps camponoti-floridani]|uniref:Microtubule associated protein n=1 Tax=Ophiocordyceps camponoti-floridani TaxID=2030778 RepID=A0A8H4Q2N3_9HYPO|nr:microtubule associated protein [Ophiocordyceps camponoti-floridani]
MDRLVNQVKVGVGQLRALLDDMGVAPHEREAREEELFTAMMDALEDRVRSVDAEKRDMIEQVQHTMAVIRQMEASLEGSRPASRDDELTISFPLSRCLQIVREKHAHVGRLHRERFEQIKKLVDALVSYSSHLEPSFFTRVYEEYTRRISTVQSLSHQIIQLWAELGTPQAQQDGAIVKYYRDAPEQLGLHDEDLSRLQAKRDRLSEEKARRERRLGELRSAVELLWEKLGVDEADMRSFLSRNRGCGVRQINEFEDELGRLDELKRQNLHLFVEDARVQLQDLWDALYFSEDEMLEFTPAFSDVYSDALLEAHEGEIGRLEALRQQRAPMLTLVERHRSLLRDRDELAASSQDASRLMMRGTGNKGEKRDPGKLLREEKTRKRVAKELPKATAEVKRALGKWEEEYGRPFLVFGERYLDGIEAEDVKRPASSRSKTMAASSSSTSSRPKSTEANYHEAASLRSRPNDGQRHGPQEDQHGQSLPSPRPRPLSSLNNSPERPTPQPASLRGAPLRAPPPKMRTLGPVPELSASGSNIVRHVEPEDVYDDNHSRTTGSSEYAGSRHTSHTSSTENWETYVDDDSDPEPDASEAYYAKVRAANRLQHRRQDATRVISAEWTDEEDAVF